VTASQGREKDSTRTRCLLNADNQLTLWGSQGFLYDLNGNMTADGTNAYTWNVRNQLASLTPDGGTADTFVYDAFGRRQKKVVNGTETDFLFDQNGNLAAELTDGGEYFASTDLSGFGADELVCRYTAGADGGLNQPLMAMTDINGSVVGLVADGGVIQANYAYEPYGNVSASGSADGNSQQYTGRENDGTGLLYYRARYYYPVTGRFVSEDPLGWRGGVNIYGYAAMDPVLGGDPSGMSKCPAGSCCYQNNPGGLGAHHSCTCETMNASGQCYELVLSVADSSNPGGVNCDTYCSDKRNNLPTNWCPSQDPTSPDNTKWQQRDCPYNWYLASWTVGPCPG
jgi:RHS repeat-associated protein